MNLSAHHLINFLIDTFVNYLGLYIKDLLVIDYRYKYFSVIPPESGSSEGGRP